MGEKDIAAEASGADIARHLARHCREVSVNVLPVRDDGVAATLFAHGILTRADLMVMGGYGHSRLREFIFGGVTRDTLGADRYSHAALALRRRRHYGVIANFNTPSR